MNILQIFPGKVWGGAEQYILDLGQALTGLGHNVLYMTRPADAVTSRLQGRVPFSTLPFRNAFDGHSARQLAQMLKGIDVIHIHDTSFVPVVTRAKRISGSNARIVLTRHIARRSKVLPWFRCRFRELHSIIFVSDLAMRLWHEANPWMPKEKCIVVHNSVPPADDHVAGQTESLRGTHGIPADRTLIVFTGRVRRSKGCITIIHALGKLADRNFAMIFIGTCKPAGFDVKLLDIARSYSIADRIYFHGFSDKTRALIREADIGVAPSIVREACHLSPMEFMQAGKCAITSDNGAQPEYITHGENGLLVPPDNAEALSLALASVIDNPELRTTIGTAACTYFNTHMSYSQFVSKTLSAYL